MRTTTIPHPVKGQAPAPACEKTAESKPVSTKLAPISGSAEKVRLAKEELEPPRPQKRPPRQRQGKMFIEVPERLRDSMERLAASGGYEDGVSDLALETTIPDEVILQSVARSLVNIQELDREQMSRVAAVALEEQIRHSDNEWDKWTVKNVLSEKTAGPPTIEGVARELYPGRERFSVDEALAIAAEVGRRDTK